MISQQEPHKQFLFSWTWGWGQFTGMQPDNMTLYGFVPVARFLKESFGWYQKALEGSRELLMSQLAVKEDMLGVESSILCPHRKLVCRGTKVYGDHALW